LLSATAQRAHSNPEPEAVQVSTGYLDPGERQAYDLPNLKQHDTLSVYLTRVSGNLDPLVAVADTKLDLDSFDARLKITLQKSPENHFKAFRDLMDSSFYGLGRRRRSGV
jgi:hypothetical protein